MACANPFAQIKKTWLAPEDTVFARIIHSVSLQAMTKDGQVSLKPWMARRDRRRSP